MEHIIDAKMLIEKFGFVVLDNQTAAHSCTLVATGLFQRIIEGISNKPWERVDDSEVENMDEDY
jgi:hypothetical protein